jgi:hypothetical protein
MFRYVELHPNPNPDADNQQTFETRTCIHDQYCHIVHHTMACGRSLLRGLLRWVDATCCGASWALGVLVDNFGKCPATYVC